MAYSLPNFNLPVGIWWASPASGAPNVITVGNLAFGRRTGLTTLGASIGQLIFFTPVLLLPKGTDVRGHSLTPVAGVVEVPRLTGRFYYVLSVEDIGKGFANEHRAALLQGLSNSWPTPYP